MKFNQFFVKFECPNGKLKKIYEVFDDDKPDLESVIPKRIVKI
jgi:hypothetical protein